MTDSEPKPMKVGLTCNKCGTEYTVVFDEITELPVPGRPQKVTVKHTCPGCGDSGDLTVTAAAHDPRWG